MKKNAVTYALPITTILILSVFVMPIPSGVSDPYLPTIDGNKVYVENSDCYISATPYMLNADGYVYLNVASKTYEGKVDFCLGFEGSYGYPTSLEVYDPRVETTQNELDLSPFFNDSTCQVEYNYTRISGKTVYDGYVWAYRNTSIVNEKNQTIDTELSRVLLQHYDVADLDAKIAYWNTTESIYWREIGNETDFENRSFDFQGMDTWYLSNAVIQKNRRYYLRMFLTVVPTLSNAVHEFFVAFKPSEETLGEAVTSKHFCYLDPWYSTSWNYRKSHIIEHAAGTGTHYQIRVVVNYGSGTDSGGTVYLGGKCQYDFDDIRFTDDDGYTLLDHWRESKTNYNSAVFWVEIKDSLSTTDRMFYLYYGNTGASTASNFDGTFIFGDPFDSSTLSTTRWPTASRTGSPTYWVDSANHFIEVYNIDANNWWNGKGFRSKSFNLPYSWRIESAYGMYQPFWFLHYSETNSEIFGGLFNVEHSDFSTSDYGVAVSRLADNWAADMHWVNDAGVGGNIDYTTGEQSYPGAGYVLKTLQFEKTSGYIKVKIDGTTRVNEYNSENGYYVHLGLARYNTYPFGLERIYAFKIRKFVADEPDHGAWGPEQQGYASIIWGTGYYPSYNPNLGGDPEKNLSEDACDYIEDLFGATGIYDKLNNYWGSQTQPSNVYNTVEQTEDYYSYTTVFYKGHIYPNCGCDVQDCPLTHNGVYDWEGTGTSNAIKDWAIHEKLSSKNTGFLFLWACGHGGQDFEGEYGAGGHSCGMIASWMGTLDLVFDGYYYTSDTSNRCFISFEMVSMNFIESTGKADWHYSDFAEKFYYYALNGYTIKDALDLATSLTHNDNSFGDCQLYEGYPAWDGVPGHGYVTSYMRVWGDTDHVIPS